MKNFLNKSSKQTLQRQGWDGFIKVYVKYPNFVSLLILKQ